MKTMLRVNTVYQNTLMLRQLVAKPFKKENELGQLKKNVSKLEREISIKIQDNQMKQHNVAEKRGGE